MTGYSPFRRTAKPPEKTHRKEGEGTGTIMRRKMTGYSLAAFVFAQFQFLLWQAASFAPDPTPNNIIINPRKRSASSKLGVGADALAAIDDFFVTSPYYAAAITCGAKASAADFVAQKNHFAKRDGEKDEIDVIGDTEVERFEVARNVAFLVYGSMYQGVAQEFIYNTLYSQWFGSGTEISVVAVKVAFDLLLQTTLLTLPMAYLTKAVIFQYSFGEALSRYWEDIRMHGLLVKYFSLWGPVQCCTFSVIPEQYRVGFIAVVSFFWIIILSTISSRSVENTDPLSRKDVSTISDVTEECALVDAQTCNIDG